jgi:hypothetical protein
MDNVIHGMHLSEESSPTLRHCLITGNGQTGITMIPNTRGRSVTFCKPVIQDCVIVQNADGDIVGGDPVIINSIIQSRLTQ